MCVYTQTGIHKQTHCSCPCESLCGCYCMADTNVSVKVTLCPKQREGCLTPALCVLFSVNHAESTHLYNTGVSVV